MQVLAVSHVFLEKKFYLTVPTSLAVIDHPKIGQEGKHDRDDVVQGHGRFPKVTAKRPL